MNLSAFPLSCYEAKKIQVVFRTCAILLPWHTVRKAEKIDTIAALIVGGGRECGRFRTVFYTLCLCLNILSVEIMTTRKFVMDICHSIL